MVDKFVFEGWIRTKLDYSQSSSFISDVNQNYFDNHTKFNLGDESKSQRIKYLEFTDNEEKIQYLVMFGYDQIGVRFTVVTREEKAKDRISIFTSSLSRVIKGYRNFKEHFSNEICPSSMNIQFASQNLLILLRGFFKGLTTKQRNNLLKKMKSALKEYTSDAKLFLLADEELIDYSDKKEMRALTGEELVELSRFDFGTILVVCGEIYLFIDHHLFGRYFILEDPSLSLMTVAKWGFISSLKLQDLHYEMKDYYGKIENLKANLDETRKSFICRGLNLRREELTGLEKIQTIIEDDLREFTNLANKIYDGVNSNKLAAKLWYVLNTMKSSPDSLFQAYGILEMAKLGRFSGFKRDLLVLGSDLKVLEMKFRKIELDITVLTLLALLLVVPVSVYASQIEIEYIADIFQILTFCVASILLVLRFWPKR